MFPEINAKMASVKTIIAELPAARPSIPSVKFAPLETAVTIKMTIGIKISQAYLPVSSPNHVVICA